MPSGFYTWSQTAALNASADSAIAWNEGQAPSSINDSARAQMAVQAKWRDDTNGKILSTGTASAYLVASNTGFTALSDLAYQSLTFVAVATNAAGATMNVDGLGAKPINGTDGVAIPAGTIIIGGVYNVTYFSSGGGEFVLHDFYGNPYNIPIGGSLEFWGATVPNSNFAFMYGQAVSRTTYATLFTMFSTTYGAGDGSTTFNIPDVRGRVTAGKDNMGGSAAGFLTTAGGGVDGATLGAVGGVQNVSLAANQIPSLTSVNASQAISVGAGGANIPKSNGGWFDVSINSGVTYNGVYAPSGITYTTSLTGTNSISVAYTNSSQVATKTVQPTIVCNRILRLI
jgi:microcystin-dependent protein